MEEEYLAQLNPTELTVEINCTFVFALDNPDDECWWSPCAECTTYMEITTWKRGNRTFASAHYEKIGTHELRLQALGPNDAHEHALILIKVRVRGR